MTRQYVHSIGLLLLVLAVSGALYLGLTWVLGVWSREEVAVALRMTRQMWAALTRLRPAGRSSEGRIG